MSSCAVFWNFIEGIILREYGINVKLHLTNIMFGVQRSNVKENIIKKINHIILIAKMCISLLVFKQKSRTKQKHTVQDSFEKQLQIRRKKVELTVTVTVTVTRNDTCSCHEQENEDEAVIEDSHC